METTVRGFLDGGCAEEEEYRVDRDVMTREEMGTLILRSLDKDDEMYIDTRHDGTKIAIAGADSHASSGVWVIEYREPATTTADTLSAVHTDGGTTTAVTRSGREIVVSPEWDVWSDSAGGFDGWYGVNVCLDGHDYTYCPDWAGGDGCELRIVDLVRHGFFAACVRDDYVPGEYKDVDDYLSSGWPWCVISDWFDAALTAALETAERRYREEMKDEEM